MAMYAVSANICAVRHIIFAEKFFLVKTNQKVELKATALISLIKVLCQASKLHQQQQQYATETKLHAIMI